MHPSSQVLLFFSLQLLLLAPHQSTSIFLFQSSAFLNGSSNKLKSKGDDNNRLIEGGISKRYMSNMVAVLCLDPATLCSEAEHDVFIGDPLLDASTTAAQLAPSVTNSSKVVDELPIGVPKLEREPLKFDFIGYSIWLEVEEFDGDVTKALDEIAYKNGILPIPAPHVTAIYGMTHLSENDVRQRFRTMAHHSKFCEGWPEELRPLGVLADVELNGVNGGLMDMTWAEITLATSPVHEEHLSALHDLFFAGHSATGRAEPWKPHLSLAYDNPQDSVLNLGDVVESVFRHSLLNRGSRRITGISLWSTYGKLQDWKCLDRMTFD